MDILVLKGHLKVLKPLTANETLCDHIEVFLERVLRPSVHDENQEKLIDSFLKMLRSRSAKRPKGSALMGAPDRASAAKVAGILSKIGLEIRQRQ